METTMMTNMTSFSKEKLDYIWGTYGIPTRYIDARFENYHPTSDEQEVALEMCRKYAGQRERIFGQGKGLFLMGPVGTGKTHLSVATLWAVTAANIDRFGCRIAGIPLYGQKEYPGYTCAMISVVEFLGIQRQSISARNLKLLAERLLGIAKICELLILDDIGAEKHSEWGEEQLFALIDLRYRMQRATIFTSNCDLKELEKNIGPRTVSRILEMAVGIRVDGEDYRKKLNRET